MTVLAPLFVLGCALEAQRLEDRTTPYAIDHRMDDRLTPYVPLVAAGERLAAMDDAEALRLALRWRSGREGGTLLDPMPARYGDGDGARQELVAAAIALAGDLAFRAEREGSPPARLRLFRAAFEPLRTVQYADVETLAKIRSRRRWIEGAMTKTGCDRAEIARASGLLRPDAARVAQLVGHMRRLRSQFRVRFGDGASVVLADPYFDSVAEGGRRRRLLTLR